MADLSDVQEALKTVVAAILYPVAPTATMQPSACGIPVLVMKGWPGPQSLDDNLKKGKTVVSVYTRPTERDSTRYPLDYEEVSVPEATYSLASAGQVITVGGAAPTPFFGQNLFVLVGKTPCRYSAQSGESAAQAAAGLGAVIASQFPGTTVSGTQIALPGAYLIAAARVGVAGTASRELGRQDREFQIAVWAPHPKDRDTVAKYIDPKLRAQSFLALADGSQGRLVYRASPFTDFDQKQGIFRRDLIFSVEYGTTDTLAAEQIVETSVETGLAPAGVPAETVTLLS
jgi:hypothetical protein